MSGVSYQSSTYWSLGTVGEDLELIRELLTAISDRFLALHHASSTDLDSRTYNPSDQLSDCQRVARFIANSRTFEENGSRL